MLLVLYSRILRICMYMLIDATFSYAPVGVVSVYIFMDYSI